MLVNPLSQPYPFSATDLAGTLNRTGIHTIKGTQAPDVNTGQPVTGSLTVGALDAIILLADHINEPGTVSYQSSYSFGPVDFDRPEFRLLVGLFCR